MPATPAPPPVTPASAALNAWLGAGLALLNGGLFYAYFFHFGASENDQLLYSPVLVTLMAAQWLALALGSRPPARRWFWVLFGLSAAAAALFWLGFVYVLALAKAFQH